MSKSIVTTVDRLSDQELSRVNSLMPWACFTLDSLNRRVGKPHSSTKRSEPQQIPDYRLVDFQRTYDLHGRSILELGSFEGVHSIGLCRAGASVHSTDGRIENVLKTAARCALYDCQPKVSVLDVDSISSIESLPKYDFIHNIGVLYHLANPVASLSALLRRCGTAMLLDTHIIGNGEGDVYIDYDGAKFEARLYTEGGISDPFSGLVKYSAWITEEGITAISKSCGFEVVYSMMRVERNGTRITLHIQRIHD